MYKRTQQSKINLGEVLSAENYSAANNGPEMSKYLMIVAHNAWIYMNKPEGKYLSKLHQ